MQWKPLPKHLHQPCCQNKHINTSSAAVLVTINAAAAAAAILWQVVICVGLSEMVRWPEEGYYLVFDGTLVCCKTFQCHGEVQHEIAGPEFNTK